MSAHIHARRGLGFWQSHLVLLVLLLAFPFWASEFLTYQIGAQALIWGIIALSTAFLAGYGGMVSLAQMSIAGAAGYAVAVLGVSGTDTSLGWHWSVVVLLATTVAVIYSVLIGWLSARTGGVYTIMITLAIGVAFYYLALQNYSVFNGFQGYQKVYPPALGAFSLSHNQLLYGLGLFWAIVCYAWITWLVRTPYGLALQGTRDNARRMASLGFDVTSIRILAYAVSGLLAGIGGVLLVWYNGLIAPGSVGVGSLINVLVVAVLGGTRHPIGAFVGSLLFVLLQTFAIDLVDRERFNLLIGMVFLSVVLFSPDGLLGLWAKFKALTERKRLF